MSRKMANQNLARICLAHDLSIGEIACALQSTQRAIHFYATGRKPMSILERKLAALFRLSVPDFRKIIFSKRRLNDRKFAACFKIVRRRNRVFWRWDGKAGTEQYLNHGECLSNDPKFIEYRKEGMRHPRKAEIRGHRIGTIPKIELWA